jgi:hypothetical protein
MVLAVSVFWACVFTFVFVLEPSLSDPFYGIPEQFIPEIDLVMFLR